MTGYLPSLILLMFILISYSPLPRRAYFLHANNKKIICRSSGKVALFQSVPTDALNLGRFSSEETKRELPVFPVD